MRIPKSAGFDAEIGLFTDREEIFFYFTGRSADASTLAPRYSTPAVQTTSHVVEAIREHPWVVVLGPGVPAIGRPNWDFGKSAGKKSNRCCT